MSVLAFAADGFEPIELLTPVDLLRRAGAKVTVAAVSTKSKQVKGAHGVTIEADAMLDDVKGQSFDLMMAPGGMGGTKALCANSTVVDLIKKQFSGGKNVSAICAAPGLLLSDTCGILKGRKGCGYPGCDDGISKCGGTKVEDPVCVDGNLITSRGPATAPLFGFALIEKLFGKDKAEEIRKQTLSNMI